MDREEASWWQEDVVGTVAICLLGFANWSNGYGVCLHLSVQHPLWSLEKNIRKYVLMRICNINIATTAIYLALTLGQALCSINAPYSPVVGKRIVSHEMPKFNA